MGEAKNRKPDEMKQAEAEQKAADAQTAAAAQQRMQMQMMHLAQINQLKTEYVSMADVTAVGPGLMRMILSDHPYQVPGTFPTPHHSFIMASEVARKVAAALIEIADRAEKEAQKIEASTETSSVDRDTSADNGAAGRPN